MTNRVFAAAPLVLAPLFLSACFSGRRAAGLPVAPGQILAGQLLNIHAPNSTGWELVTSSIDGVEFAKHGDDSVETYGAQVLKFGPPAFVKPEEFLAFVKDGVAREISPRRFDLVSSDIKLWDARPYPCVRVEYVARDKKARTSMLGTKTLLLQTRALYCRHPTERELGFAIIFSHRGRAIDPNLQTLADDFIQGVDVPGR